MGMKVACVSLSVVKNGMLCGEFGMVDRWMGLEECGK